MKRSHPFLLLTILAVLAIGFSSFSKGKGKKKFQGYTKGPGNSFFLEHKKGIAKDSAEYGGAVFVKLKFKTEKDSIFLDINDATKAPSYPMRVDSSKYKGDFMYYLKKLHVGDSVSFFMSLDSLKKYYKNEFSFEAKYDTMKYLGFVVLVDSVYTKAKVDGIRAKAAADQAEQQMKMQKAMAIMQPIVDSAKVKEPMLREKDFELLSNYIKTTWKGPRNPDQEGIFYMETSPPKGPQLKPGMTVSIKYTGKYLDGTIFDSNTIFPGQDMLTFRLGVDQMIQGFNMCISRMSVGSKALFILPPRLGYSDGLTRIFEVEVVSAK